MPRPLHPGLRPFDDFVGDRGPEIIATLRGVCRAKGRLPTGLSVEDVVQHAMAELKRRYGRMADETAAVKFAVKVGSNFLVDEYRAEKSRADEAWRAHVVQCAGQPPSAEQAALTRMRHGRLGEGLRRLPERQRRAVELFYFERLKRKQIAELFGVPESTVKGLLQRALASLREDMKHAPVLVPLARLRRGGRVAVVAAPRIATVMLTLTVLSGPAPMIPAPHAEAFAVPAVPPRTAAPDRHPMLSPGGGQARQVEAAARTVAAGPAPNRRRRPAVQQQRKKGVRIGVQIGDDQVGRFGGDNVCIHTGTGQEPSRPCANQDVVGTCPLLRRVLIHPYMTCERHGDPMYDPPPLP